MNNPTPMVDLVIAVHDPARPVERAVESALQSGLSVPGELRISVVCHNIPRESIERKLSQRIAGSVRFLELADGRSSPAGPFMFGLREAEAKYVSIMGSDDFLEAGALGAWLELAERSGLTAVIPPERHAAGAKVRTPPVRRWHGRTVDATRDRLAYRTAPLGLIRRDAITRLGLEMSSDLQTGEDQLFSAKLWFSGEPIAYARGKPHYVVGADAAHRVTTTARAAVEELRAVSELIADPWFVALDARARRSLAAKIARLHIFPAAASRSEADSWTMADRTHLADVVRALGRSAPGYDRVLAIADRRLLDAIMETDAPSVTLGRLASKRRQFGHPTTVLTRSAVGFFAPDGPIRFMTASALL